MWNMTIAAAIQDVMAEARASGLFVSTCSFYQPDGLYDQGTPSGNYVIVSALSNIPCMCAPFAIAAPGVTEDKKLEYTLSINANHLLLDDDYSDVTWTGTDGNTYTGPQTQMRAYVTNALGVLTIYDILGPEEDSQSTQTRLKVRVAQI